MNISDKLKFVYGVKTLMLILLWVIQSITFIKCCMLLTICSCDFMLWLTILERQYSMGFYCASMFECMTDQLWTRQGKPKVIKNWLAHIDPPNS